MDLEAYRRQYMQIEGVVTTPVYIAKSFANFAKSFRGISAGYNQDKAERGARKERRALAKEILNDKDSSALDKAGAVKDMATNLPFTHKNMRSAMENLSHAGQRAAMSLNELGQTSKNIVGGTRSNLYDGQDMENGIRLGMKAIRMCDSCRHMPEHAIKKATSLASFGAITVQHVGSEISAIRKEKSRTIPRPKEKDIGLEL